MSSRSRDIVLFLIERCFDDVWMLSDIFMTKPIEKDWDESMIKLTRDRRSDNDVVFFMNFSYSLMSFRAFWSFAIFLHSSYCESHSFYLTRYSRSRRAVIRLLINRSISYDLIVSMSFFISTDSDSSDRERLKESMTESETDLSWAINTTEWIRQWWEKFKR
jgi:hypothetical protein